MRVLPVQQNKFERTNLPCGVSISGCRREMETAANCLIAPVTSRVIRMPSFGRIYDAPTLILSAIRHHFRRNSPFLCLSLLLCANASKRSCCTFLRIANLKEHQRCDKGPALGNLQENGFTKEFERK